jgi:putative ABC transport system substrate-binding protein
LDQKGLELLHELAPAARRILYLVNSSNPLTAQVRDAVQGAAHTVGVQLVTLDARNVSELDMALRGLRQAQAQAFLTSGDLFLLEHRAQIARAVRAAKLPAMFPYREYHDAEVLISYGPSLKRAMRLVAGYVDKILKGARPADLPVEQLSKYELIIDLRVARELRLEVPQSLQLLADEVIR